MATEDVLSALAARWPETAPYLTPDDLRLVRDAARLTSAAAAGTGSTREAQRALLRLTMMLVERLPAAHPVSDAISGGTRFAESSSRLGEIAAMLDPIAALSWTTTIHEESEPVPPADLGQPGEDESDEAAERLLAAPTLTGQQIRAGGADPGQPGLIRLPGPAGQQIPSFQFTRAGQPIPVVLAVNRLLDADDDPFGVADWWLGRNAWLEGVPADLIGLIDDMLLVRAAQAELGGE